MRENFCPIINFVLSVQYTPYVQKLPPPCPILVYHFNDKIYKDKDDVRSLGECAGISVEDGE